MQLRKRPDPALLAMALAGLLLVPWFLVGPGGTRSSWALQSAIDVLNMFLAARLFRLPGTNRHARRFWVAAGIAMAFSAAGDGYQTVLVLIDPSRTTISPVQTGLVVAGMAIVMITTLGHPFGGAGRQRLRIWLDAATVLTAVAVFLWYFLLAGQVTAGRAGDRLGAAATASVMLLVTFGLVKLIFSASAPFTRTAGIVGAIGVTGTAVLAPVVELLTDHTAPGVLSLAQLMPCVLVPISFRLQELLTCRRAGVPVATARRGFSRLPYVAVASTQILLLAALPGIRADLRIWGIAAGVVLITALVLARQVAAFHDNEQLVDELDQQKQWFSALVQHASDLTVVTAADGGTVQYASPAAERILGLPADRLTGELLSARVHPDDHPVLGTLIERLSTAVPGTNVDAEIRLRHADGTYRWLQVIGTDLRAVPSVGGVVWNGRDITESHRLQAELRHQATHDSLTGLANRTLLEQRLRDAAPEAPIAVLLMDLDGFKLVNDNHGHHAGDQVLVSVAERTRAALPPEATVARLGGDEFAVLLPGADADRAAACARAIEAAVAAPIAIAGAVVGVGTSIGVAAGTRADAARMLRDADADMYRRKQSRRAAPVA